MVDAEDLGLIKGFEGIHKRNLELLFLMAHSISFSRENVGDTKSTPSHTQMDCIMAIIYSKDSTKIKAESDASNFVYRNLQV